RSLNGGVSNGSDYRSTTGDAYLTLADPSLPATCPRIPVDIDEYFTISDKELLDTIDLWAALKRIRGWPTSLSEWDFWLLQVIDFWANVGGYTYDGDASKAAEEPRWKKSP
ncbi:MAG: hypothetical protein NC911_08365, partial [Candidatus Omnitrophica bacterium]|nr:hypothetical protein [Candidatus Omnitrophota bacterium]